jgi:hypothetical protein
MYTMRTGGEPIATSRWARRFQLAAIQSANKKRVAAATPYSDAVRHAPPRKAQCEMA